MSALSDNERQFLTYALDLAENRMVTRPGEFSEEDDAALRKLRHVATCQECSDTIEFCGRESDD